jgi:hypothetical protein
MPIQLRIGIKTMLIRMRTLPQVLHMLENRARFFLLLFTIMPVYIAFLSSSVPRYFEKHIEIFMEKVKHVLDADAEPAK